MVREIINSDFDGLMSLYMQLITIFVIIKMLCRNGEVYEESKDYGFKNNY